VIATNAADEELVASCQTGDGPAFRHIVERYQAMVCAVTYSILGDLALSEDAAQEAFVVAWQQLHTLRDATRLRSWLAGIARNVAHAGNRKRGQDVVHRAEPIGSASPVATNEPLPDEQTARREEEVILWTVLAQVPETYREALVLYYREHQSVQEVAEAMELSEDAVKQRLARGRQVLKAQVEEYLMNALRRTGPSAAFTASVVTALNASAGKAAAAGTAALVSQATGGLAGTTAGATVGLVGGIAGAMIGVAGAAVGVTCSIRSARSPRERAYLVKISWITCIAVALEVGIYLYVAFCQRGLFTSVWFQTAFWGLHSVALVTAIIITNKRLARIQIEDGTRPGPMAASSDSAPREVFQWNAGGWFGSQVGCTLWMLLGAGFLFREAPLATLVWLTSFALINMLGVILWRRRERWRAYDAIQCLIVATGVLSLVCVAIVDRMGKLPELTFGHAYPQVLAYGSLLIFPVLMVWFYVLNRMGKSNGDQSK